MKKTKTTIPDPQLIYFYRGSLFITYKWNRDKWNNKYFENKPWECVNEWFLKFGFDKKIWEKDEFYYDGHTLKWITILGFTMGIGYSYESKEDDFPPPQETAPI